jgi:hypothetical protein
MTGGDGSGNITVVVDPPKLTACYIMNVVGLDGVTMAHIHTGAAGQNGGPGGHPRGADRRHQRRLRPVTKEVADALLANPAGYYVNVHTRTFPNGAIRGSWRNRVSERSAAPAATRSPRSWNGGGAAVGGLARWRRRPFPPPVPAGVTSSAKESDMRTRSPAASSPPACCALAGAAAAQGDNPRNHGSKVIATLTGASEADGGSDRRRAVRSARQPADRADLLLDHRRQHRQGHRRADHAGAPAKSATRC